MCDRIGIIDKEKLIELVTLSEFRHKYEEGILVKQMGEGFKYDFPSIEEANNYINGIEDKTGMMIKPSNLEDILVKLTGHQL